MNRGKLLTIAAAAALLAALSNAQSNAQSTAQSTAESTGQDAPEPVEPVNPPAHTNYYWPQLGTGATQEGIDASYSLSPELRRGMSAISLLRDRRRLDAALDALEPQRAGEVDAYVVSVALDSDPVFAREAREAGRVLARRYDAQGRTLVMAGPDGRSAGLPHGSIASLIIALARVAEMMDGAEDVLVMYTTSHGSPLGLGYHYGDEGYGVLSPDGLRDVLAEVGIERRILVISACYSGVFVPFLQSDNTAILTAASDDRSSFGCEAENDWTYFGDALINNALRQPQSLSAAATQARKQIDVWETGRGQEPSQPQYFIGDSVGGWLRELEQRMPDSATDPVGQPAVGE